MAGVLALDAARDSLRGVAAQLESIDYRLPRVEVAERYFLDYDSVAFSSKPVYSYQNPIPECRVYANGTIYRILLGTFNTKRAAATFRGAYPLFYLINDEGKWCYYAGGFATLAEAEAALRRGDDPADVAAEEAAVDVEESAPPASVVTDEPAQGKSSMSDGRGREDFGVDTSGESCAREGGEVPSTLDYRIWNVAYADGTSVRFDSVLGEAILD